MVNVKILGISTSPRHGNTEILVKEALNAASALQEVETDFISVADLKIAGGCKGDYACWKVPLDLLIEKLCIQYKDDVNDVFRKMMWADGMIIGVAVYFGGVSAQFKNIIDRSIPLEILKMRLRNKVGGVVTVGIERFGGHESAIEAVHRFFFIHDMIACTCGPEWGARNPAGGSSATQGFPHVVHSTTPGEKTGVLQDKDGLKSARDMGKRVTELAKVIKAGFEVVPEKELGWPKALKIEDRRPLAQRL